MERVVIPKEVAEAIEELLICDYTYMDIIKDINNENFKSSNSYIHSAVTRIQYWVKKSKNREDQLLNALVNGYSIERSKFGEFYDYFNTLTGDERLVAKKVLDILEINMNDYV